MRVHTLAASALALALAAVAPARPSERPPAPASPTGDGKAPAATAAPASQPPGLATPAEARPTLRLGALLPVSGPAAWFAQEIRRGLDLAIAELGPTALRRPTQVPAAPASVDPTASPGNDPSRGSVPGTPGAPSEPGPARVEAEDKTPAVILALEVADTPPSDTRHAEREVARLLAGGVAALLTASPTPTLAVHRQAATADVPVVHLGLPGGRWPPGSRTIWQLRPSAALLGEALGAHAWTQGIRRLAWLAPSDDFGRASRAALASRWRAQGGVPVHDETLSLDASDLKGRLARLARQGPEAVALLFRGTELGEAARHVREAGYQGLLLALDDDQAALLTAGPTLDRLLILADAFVPVPGTRGDRFAAAYEARHRSRPSRFAADAYEAVFLLAEAARGSLEAGGGLGGAHLRNALLARRRLPALCGGELVVREDGSIERPLALFRVAGGKADFDRYLPPAGLAP